LLGRERSHGIFETVWAAAVLVLRRCGGEEVGESACEDSSEGGCYGDDGDVGRCAGRVAALWESEGR
jgi:hypothetical protein